jgi:hypothetical protein
MLNNNYIFYYETKASNKHSLILIHSLDEWAKAFKPKRNWLKPEIARHGFAIYWHVSAK